MTPNFRKHRMKWLWWFGVVVGAALLVSFRSGGDKNVLVPTQTRAAEETQRSLYIFDKLPWNRTILFSRESAGDLWLRDAQGHECYVASNVVCANFSPDGKKFAYATESYDLFIETIEGKPLAHLAGAIDHRWRADSASLTFSAMASIDYPDLQQTVVYDLNRNQTTYLPVGE